MKKLSIAAVLFSLFSVQFASAHVPAPGFHHRRAVECLAKNRRGQTFSARGFNQSFVQREAMMKCKRHSRQCVPVGCHRVGHGL